MKKPIRFITVLSFLLYVTSGFTQDDSLKTFEVYGFIMTDVGYNANQIHPDWFDVVRPTKLPAFENEYGTDGNAYFSVRQTRFGTKAFFPTTMGDLKTTLEWELFGTGADAGQTTIRLRHAYAELGKFGVGQYWSPFMDIEVFPNTVEYWGPNGMVFFRNVQVRYMPIQGDTRLTIALERPGASADQGNYAGRVELQGVSPKFPYPDLSAEYRRAFGFGYIELATILRYIEWVDLNNDPIDLSDNVLGWGFNLSSNVHIGENTTGRFQIVYGEGIQNYMNDAPTDIGIKNNFSNPNKPILGVPLPMLGIVAFFDHNWNEKFSSSLGYSMLDIDNSDGQAPNAFNNGNYAIVNLLYYPVTNAMMGVEFQYGDRTNNSDGWDTSIFKVQFSFKYNFSQAWYRQTRK